MPAIVNFGVFSLVALPLAALYAFAILPAIDGFPMLVAVLAPLLLYLGAFIPNPKYAGSALAVIMGFCNALTLQETFTADAASFLNANLGQFVGLFCAVFVTAALRSMSAEASVRRLLAQTWTGLARLARARSAPEPAAFAARLVDRLSLLTPKLAAARGGQDDRIAIEALRDLRIGMNLVAIQDLRAGLSGAPRAQLDALLDEVADYFAERGARGPASEQVRILAEIDAVLLLLVGPQSPERTPSQVRGVTNLVGLRRNLFPAAPAYVPEVAT